MPDLLYEVQEEIKLNYGYRKSNLLTIEGYGKDCLEMDMRELSMLREMVSILIGVVVTLVYIFIKTH